METTAPPPPPPSSLSSPTSVSFYGFLDRMRNPASLDLVRSIKSFIVSFSFYPMNSDTDGKKVQEFFGNMEVALRDHPLWAGAREEEIDHAMEDSKVDREISGKIFLLQTFLRPEHLDILPILRNESSWLLAEKELQRMNAFKAPHEKLLCVMNCCRVINNLLRNASTSENHTLGGADDFFPVLIYVTIKGYLLHQKATHSTMRSLKVVSMLDYPHPNYRIYCAVLRVNQPMHISFKRQSDANPPQLHSNLKFIQLYRRQEKLVSEAPYYFTNLISAKSFIINLSAKSLSIDEIEFGENMQAAKVANVSVNEEPVPAFNELSTQGNNDAGPSGTINGRRTTNVWSQYPFMALTAGDLTVGDAERLLKLHKDVVVKYTNLYEAFRRQQSLLNSEHHSEEIRADSTQTAEMNSTHDSIRVRR